MRCLLHTAYRLLPTVFSVSADHHLADLHRGRGELAAEAQIIADHLNAAQDVAEVASDGDFFNGTSQLAVLNPEARRAARIIAGHGIETEADHLSNVETLLDRSDDLGGRVRARSDEKVIDADARRAHQAARRIGR